MKLILLLTFLVFISLISAHKTEDSENSDLADTANNMNVANVELHRDERDSGKNGIKKGLKRVKKGGNGREMDESKGKKKDKNSKSKSNQNAMKKKKQINKKKQNKQIQRNKNKQGNKHKQGNKNKQGNKKEQRERKKQRNQKKQINNNQKNNEKKEDKLFCCCNKKTGEKICRTIEICLDGFIQCPTQCPAPPPCKESCEADLAQKIKDMKKVTNWIKQYKRLSVFLKRVSNKKSKSDNFVDAALALEKATMSGTMCGGGGPDADANAARDTLKKCEKKIESDCMCNVTAPNNTCEADLQKILDDMNVCMNKPANEICTCFQAIPAPNAQCNPQTELKGATACNNVCQKTWGICSVALKDAGPLVDKCKCDCSKSSTTPISTAASSGRRHFINLRNFHNYNNNMRN